MSEWHQWVSSALLSSCGEMQLQIQRLQKAKEKQKKHRGILIELFTCLSSSLFSLSLCVSLSYYESFLACFSLFSLALEASGNTRALLCFKSLAAARGNSSGQHLKKEAKGCSVVWTSLPGILSLIVVKTLLSLIVVNAPLSLIVVNASLSLIVANAPLSLSVVNAVPALGAEEEHRARGDTSNRAAYL